MNDIHNRIALKDNLESRKNVVYVLRHNATTGQDVESLFILLSDLTEERIELGGIDYEKDCM